MKIGFVLDDSLDKPDGVQQYVLTLGRYLRASGHQVHYLVGETKRNDIAHVHSLSRNIGVRFNGNVMSIPLPAHRAPIQQLLEREKYDVLHVQVPYSPMLAARVIKLAPPSTAVVGTFHIVPYSWRESFATRLLRVFIWRSLRRFDQVVSVSPPAASFARRSLGVRSLVVPNAVNVAAFQVGKRLRKYNDGKVNVVFLGRLVERKGCMHLLRAVEQLHTKYRLFNVRVLICGTGPLLPDLQAYVQKHRLGAIVHFLGFVKESAKADLLASADIAVFPSLGGESFGIVLVEAMAAGSSVVVAGKNKGYRSVLRGQSSQLVNPHDTVAFAKVLKHFIVNNAARQRAKRWQQASVGQYDTKVVAENMLAIYSRMIAKRES